MQLRKGLMVIAVLFFSMTLCAGLAQANLLSNGSFESPVVTAGTYSLVSTGQTLIPGWSVVGAAGNVAVTSGTFTQYGYTFPAQDGSQWLDQTGISNTATGVQQAVSTTAGTTYDLSFWSGNVVGNIFGTTTTVNVLVNGTQILAAENTGGATTQNWLQFTISFMATESTTTLAFLNGDPVSDNHNGLDNVVLTEATPIPIPGAIWLLGSGLIGLIGLKRKFR
jgi:hypothetical protein